MKTSCGDYWTIPHISFTPKDENRSNTNATFKPNLFIDEILYIVIRLLSNTLNQQSH